MQRAGNGWKTLSNPSITLWDKTLSLAYKACLVEKVYVQYSKKNKVWTTMKHRVQFTPDSGY